MELFTIRSCSNRVISILLFFVVVIAGGRIRAFPTWLFERVNYGRIGSQVWKKTGLKSEKIRCRRHK
jgi:hypothetical protein